MEQTSKPWEGAAVIAVLLAMMFVCGAFSCASAFSVLSLGLLPVIGAGTVFLWQWRRKKTDLLFLPIGVLLAYAGGLLTNGFSLTDPFSVTFVLLSFLYSIPLLIGKKFHLSRTAIILFMTVLFAIGFLLWQLGRFRWFLGADFFFVLRDYLFTLQDELVALMLEVGQDTLTEADVRNVISQVLMLVPALMAMLAITMSWFSTWAYRVCCQKNHRRDLLPTPSFEITMSLFSAILYAVLFFGTAIVRMTGNLWVYGAVRNVMLLLTPGFAYLQLRRTVFQIKSRQLPPNFWFYFVIVAALVLIDPIEGLTIVAVLGAGGMIWRRITAHYMKQNGE